MQTLEREWLGLALQLLQLAATFAILHGSTQQLLLAQAPGPPGAGAGSWLWFSYRPTTWAVLQALAAAVAALGLSLLLAGVLAEGGTDGSGEWQGLFAARGTPPTPAAAFGAVLLAPLTEELYFRGYVLPSLTRWCHPLAAVAATTLLFAAAHPQPLQLQEALLGGVLSFSVIAAEGNLLVPTGAHALYNGMVLTAGVLQSM